MTDEQRLDQLREQAWEKGTVSDRGVDVAGGPIPASPGITANQSLGRQCGPGKFRFISSSEDFLEWQRSSR
jgi:hypothetical protein